MTRTLTIHEKIEENRSFRASEPIRRLIFSFGIVEISNRLRNICEDKNISIFLLTGKQTSRLYRLTTLVLRKQIKFNRNFKITKP